MSVKIMGLIWDYDIPRDEKFILLAYADHASHDGTNVYPAVATIAKKTGYSERSVQSITRKLEQMGLLIADGKGAKGTNKWRIPSAWGAEIAPAKFVGVQNEAPGGAENDIKGVQWAAPDPSLNHPEPSIKEAAPQNSENPKKDGVDFEIHYHLKPKSIKDAFTKYFKLTPNWETKYNRQVMEFLLGVNATAEQVEHAADVWRKDKKFNWQAPSLKGVQEHWLELVEDLRVPVEDTPEAYNKRVYEKILQKMGVTGE